MAIRTYIWVFALKVNGLNAPTERHRLAEWIQKQDPYICCQEDNHIRSIGTYRLKVRGWKKVFHGNGNQKKDGVAILISDKIDLKIKTVTRDKQGYHIMIRGPVQDDITIVNICTQNKRTSMYKANVNRHKRKN